MLTVTEKQCQASVKKWLASKSLYEATSGKGDDFCDAIGSAMFEMIQATYNDVKLYNNTHIHTYSPPAAVTGTVSVPMV